ncbi:hypothetical protein Syun_014559 [Stephania yunnanensis]|uniref:Uncharacterized protein n=1 Tax=Stephania yunnanensis TaxID=152371 RepID=A0AAP0JK17_9MAGN
MPTASSSISSSSSSSSNQRLPSEKIVLFRSAMHTARLSTSTSICPAPPSINRAYVMAIVLGIGHTVPTPRHIFRGVRHTGTTPLKSALGPSSPALPLCLASSAPNQNTLPRFNFALLASLASTSIAQFEVFSLYMHMLQMEL